MFLRGHSYLERDSIGSFGRNIMAAYLFVVILWSHDFNQENRIRRELRFNGGSTCPKRIFNTTRCPPRIIGEQKGRYHPETDGVSSV